MIATSGPAPAKTNSYDAAGNLRSDGTIKYTYGMGGRLESASAAGGYTSYRYNGLGQRVAKNRKEDVIAYYVYDNEGQLLGEYDGRGNPIQETIYLENMPVAVIAPSPHRPKSTDIYYVYPDHLGAPRILTRASDSTMVWRWDKADPFGLYQPDENPRGLGNFTYNLRFPGQVFDKETNNFYNYYRDYDPQLGRYIESDPIGLQAGTNTYAYVGAKPTSNIDPLGLADINLFPPSQPGLYRAGEAWSPAGVFSVAGHGSFYNMSDWDDNIMWPDRLARMIRDNPAFHGQRIVLGSCNTARKGPDPTEPTFAQRLANYLGVPVTASTDFVYPKLGDLQRIPTNGVGGHWVNVYPEPGYKGAHF